MIIEHLQLADAIAVAYAREHPVLDRDDLIQAARLGLCEAASRYDESRGSFSTFAYPRIRGAVLDEARKHRQHEALEDWPDKRDEEAVDVARDRLHRLSELSIRERDIALDKMAGYSQREIAAELGVSEGRVSQIAANIKQKLT